MNFSESWIQWIMECVFSIEYSLLLIGSLTQPFTPTRGVRQRDPISPYLFLVCANILSIVVTQVEHQKKINGVKIGRNVISFTHLFYADDSFFFLPKEQGFPKAAKKYNFLVLLPIRTMC